MTKKHATVLPMLTNRLNLLRDQQIRPLGIAGLGGHGVNSRVPGIDDSRSVSHTHPYRFEDEDEEQSA